MRGDFAIDPSKLKGAKKAALPQTVEPCLAVLAESRRKAIIGCMKSSSMATGLWPSSRMAGRGS